MNKIKNSLLRNKKEKVVAIICFAMFFSMVGCTSSPKNVQVVKEFSLPAYLETWYEIARLDHSFEKNLIDVTANYTLNEDGTVRVENNGYNTKKEKEENIVGKARLRGLETEGALEVSFFGPFFADYNIIALDENYQYALVCGSTYKYLWILSRTPTIPDDVKMEYLTIAKELGYDTDALLWVEHRN